MILITYLSLIFSILIKTWSSFQYYILYDSIPNQVGFKFTMYYLILSGYFRAIDQNREYSEWSTLIFENWYYWCEIVSKIVPIFLWLAVIFCDMLWHHGRKGRWPKSVLFYHFMSIFITANHLISFEKLGFDSRRLHHPFFEHV